MSNQRRSIQQSAPASATLLNTFFKRNEQEAPLIPDVLAERSSIELVNARTGSKDDQATKIAMFVIIGASYESGRLLRMTTS